MSVEAIAVALHHSRAKGTTKLVLIGIANHAGDGGAWPAVVTLAKYAGCSERQVQRALRQLVSFGEIRVHVQAGGGSEYDDGRRPNRYDVIVACPPWCDRTTNHRDTRRLAGPQIVLEGVTPVSPVKAQGVTPASPVGVTPVSPKPSLSTDHPPRLLATTGRARACRECAQSEDRCRAIPEAISGHTFEPGDEYTTRITS